MSRLARIVDILARYGQLVLSKENTSAASQVYEAQDATEATETPESDRLLDSSPKPIVSKTGGLEL